MTHKRDFRLIKQNNLIKTIKYASAFYSILIYLPFLATKNCGYPQMGV